MGLVGASGPAFAWPESFFWGGGSFRDSVAFLIGVVGVFWCGDPAGCGAPVVFPLGQDFGGGRGLWGAQEESPFGDDGLVVGTGTALMDSTWLVVAQAGGSAGVPSGLVR